MFRPLWSSPGASKLMLKISALPSMNTIPNCTLLYAPMCSCTSVTCNSNCVSISLTEYIGVSHSVAGCVLTCSAG
jgi:hypothetical protein